MILDRTNAQRSRRGTTSLEVVVAFTLLTTAIGLAAPLIVAHNRLLVAQRHERLALDELSNQIERLSTLSADELPSAVAELGPSSFAAEHLPGAKLAGRVAPTDRGSRVTLEITWDQPNRQAAPLRLTAWIAAPADSGARGGEETP
jgi:hypothetical protein